MKKFLCLSAIIIFSVSTVFATTLPPCLGGVSVSTFRLLLQPAGKGPALPLNSVNIIRPGEKLEYEPIHVPNLIKEKAQIAIVLIPVPKPSTGKGGGDEEKQTNLVVLEARPAKSPAEWDIPERASIVGIVFGPRGLDIKKVSSLAEKNEDLIPQLADYAQQTATVEALLHTLSQYEESPTTGQDLNAALTGFSAEYGVPMPKLDSATSTNQQAALLLQAVVPPLSTYDPGSSNREAVIAQSTGLATAVAGLFFGTPVGLAAGGAAVFLNLRTIIFPDTEFHPAFAQFTDGNGLALCEKGPPPKPRTRPAFLWMLRLPDVEAPSASLPEPEYLPLGGKSTLKIACASPSQLKILPRVRDWELVSSAHTAAVPVAVKVGTADDSLEMDLSHTKLPAGEYRLAAKWDWDAVEVQGAVNLRPFGDFSKAKVSVDSEDRLLEGAGPVKIQLMGTDFEFVSKVAIVPTGDNKAIAKTLSFTLPEGTGERTSMELEIDTSAFHAGSYLLKLTQTDESTHDLAITIHPPNPTLSNLPLRVNLGEPQQPFTLEGTGLERIEEMSSEGATWVLAPAPPEARDLHARKATVKLLAQAKMGENLDASMKVRGLHTPLKISQVLQVAGPRPRIISAKGSAPQAAEVALRPEEIPAGTAASFSIQIENGGTHPTLDLSCANAGSVKQPLTLHPGDRSGTAQLDFAGEGALFLSVDPGSVGLPGCQFVAAVTVNETGTSDPYTLGRVVRLPHIEKFSLTAEKIGNNLYAGVLTGQELQSIEKTGWDAKNGYAVLGIPTPTETTPQEQTLKIELPWPSPSPNAPLYVWLRGETEGRITQAKY